MKKKAYVKDHHCVACGTCLNVCPKNTITINYGMHAKIGEDCVGCGLCAKACPASIIEIKKREIA